MKARKFKVNADPLTQVINSQTCLKSGAGASAEPSLVGVTGEASAHWRGHRPTRHMDIENGEKEGQSRDRFPDKWGRERQRREEISSSQRVAEKARLRTLKNEKPKREDVSKKSTRERKRFRQERWGIIVCVCVGGGEEQRVRGLTFG